MTGVGATLRSVRGTILLRDLRPHVLDMKENDPKILCILFSLMHRRLGMKSSQSRTCYLVLIP